MHTNDDAQVVEFRPSDVLSHVEGDRPHGIVTATDGRKMCVEFAYGMMADYTYDAPEARHVFTPILNSDSVQTLVQMGAVRWTHVETGTAIIGVLDCDRDDRQHDAHDALKEAFHAHDDEFGGFGGKDPRRVWSEYADVKASVPEATDYFPVQG